MTAKQYAIFLLTCASLLAFAACSSSDSKPDGDADKVESSDGDMVEETSETVETLETESIEETGDGEESSSVIAPHRESRGIFTVVWLAGTAYEMGYQHGDLLKEELAEAIDYIQSDPILGTMVELARKRGILDLAYANSFQDIIDECKGLADACKDNGVDFSQDQCMVLNFGDVLVEFLMQGMPETKLPAGVTAEALKRRLQPGCSEVAVSGAATADGRLYHGRILDWDEIEYILEFPTIFVRQPTGGIAHTIIGFPGNISPYTGMNVKGISLGSNEADPLDNTVHDLVGRSHVQMMHQILKTASTMEEVTHIVTEETDHMSVELVMVCDGVQKKSSVFEMTGVAVGVRPLADDGTLFATNHFVSDAAKDLDAALAPGTETSSTLRFARWAQIVPQDGKDTLHGTFSPETLIQATRDRVNPFTGEESPKGTFDNNLSIATNGALFVVIMDPERLLFWVAAGTIPVPEQKFVGFSLGELLGLPEAYPVEPAEFQ